MAKMKQIKIMWDEGYSVSHIARVIKVEPWAIYEVIRKS